MIDMDAVSREIRAAHVELDAPENVKGILSLGTRTRIWIAMDDPDDPEAAYRHRVVLQMLCVRRVQHYWDRAFPGDTRVEEMLTLAQQLIDRQSEPRPTERRAESFLVHVYDEVEDFDDVNQRAVYVADAASHTVTSAGSRNPDYDTADGIEDDDRLTTGYCLTPWSPATPVPVRRAGC